MKVDKNVNVFLTITKEAIKQEIELGEFSQYKDADWMEVLQLAVRNKLLEVMFPVIDQIYQKNLIPDEVYANWNSITKISTIYQYRHYYAIRQVIAACKGKDILPILFKGCVLAEQYPKYVLRSSSDTDIYVYDCDRKKMEEVFKELGYDYLEEESKHKVQVFKSKELNHIIELHTCLWEDYSGPKMTLLENMNLTSRDSLITITACGIELTTLGHTEHLIYQMFHIIKHFSIEGISIRYLLDITLFIHKYHNQIDFERFWDCMEKLQYTKFTQTLFWICIKYFDLNKDVFLGQKITEPDNVEDLLKDLLAVGISFDDCSAQWQILGIMTPYLVGEESYSKSKLTRKLKVLFPSNKALSEDYAYAKRHRILVPIAWIHRDIKFIIKRHQNKKDWYDASDKLKIAEHRISLMNDLGLIGMK
ncbi:MAG: nucleotidyltransferase family protein [bacterium]|nr:nucleotidyltransferase family protein [bacterium]